MILLFGALCSLFIGISLGLLGSGGSILAIPMLILLFGLPPKRAIALGFPLVGLSSGIGFIVKGLKQKFPWRVIALFGVSTFVGSYATAQFARSIPGHIQWKLFAIVLVVTGVLMLRAPNYIPPTRPLHRRFFLKIAAGLIVGALTGILGVGGGFLMVPVLVLLVGLPMKMASLVSLALITVNCALAFSVHYVVMTPQDWNLFVILFPTFLLGFFLGNQLTKRVTDVDLRQMFGYCILLVATGAFIHAFGLISHP